MRLYICIDGTYAGTQADANAKGKGWSQVDVPTDKAGLIDFLNGMVSEARSGTNPELLTNTIIPERAAPVAPIAKRAPAPVPSDGAEAIGDWLYRDATSSEVHDVFMCLAARFDDATRQRKAA